MPSTRLSKNIDAALAADQSQMIQPDAQAPQNENATANPLQESIVNQNMLSPEQVLAFAKSPEGMKLADWVKRQYNTLRSARRPYERQWYTNLSFYMGKQYVEWSSREDKLIPLPKLDKYTPRITVNKIRPIVRTEMSKLTSQRPSASVMPASNDDEDVFSARAGEQVWQSLYDRLHFNKILTSASYWLSVTGNAYIKTFWDGSAYDSYSKTYGDIRWAALSPFNILVPDLLEEDFQSQTYVLCVYSKPIEWIEIMYEEVIPDGMSIVASGDVEDIMSSYRLGITGGNARPASALIIEAWIKPGATKLLPKGGFVTIVNDQIIQAGLNGIPYSHGEFPFAKMSHVPTGRYYSESVITDLVPLQMEYNRTQSQIIEAKNRTSKPQMLYDEGSVVPQKITTEPGLWIPIRPNAIRPQPIPLQDLPAYVVQFNERQERNFEDLSGQHEVSRGGAPGGVSAATAIAYLAERDDSYLSTTISSLEMAVESVARQSLTLAAEYWDVPRLIKATGEDGGYEAVLLKGSQISNGVDIRVESGSALPQSKSARMANVMDFMKMGYMAPQEGFELLDMPMLQQWTTRRGIDKRAAQTENVDFKHLNEQVIAEADAQYQQQVMAGMVQIDPQTGMPPQRGSVIPINDWDNDDVHIEIHELMQKASSYKLIPEFIKQEVENHVAQHKARRYARMIGMIPPVGPQPGGAYEPGNSGGQGQAPMGSDGPGAMPPAGMDPTMTSGTGPDQAQ